MSKPKKLSNHISFSKKHLIVFIALFALVGGLVLWRSLALNPNLPGDVNNDNIVNITDLSILLSSYGTTNTNADLNSDGTVNVLDMSILLSNYGRTYTPTTIPDNAFRGIYYDNSDFTNQKLVRVDNAINFDWDEGTPDPSIGIDTFSVVWEGNFNFDSANYDFTATPDDGVKLFVDGQLIIDKWFVQSATAYTATKAMTAGKHQIKMQYYEADGAAVAKLAWSKQSSTPPPPPPPPPSGNVLFDGGFEPGNFSKWPNHEMLDQATVVDTPNGKMMRARTSGSVSMVNIGQNFSDYQLPWEVIPSDVWHGFNILLPDGNNSSYPGIFIPSTPGSGWNVVWELHNRTDSQSGYNYPGSTPGSYVSTVLSVKNQGDGTVRWQLRMSGGTLPVPVHTYNEVSSAVQYNRVYKHAIRIKHGHTSSTGYFEWWVDGTKIAEGAVPTAYLCADGLSGERLQYGIYRGGYSGITTLYMGNLKVGNSRAAVGMP